VGFHNVSVPKPGDDKWRLIIDLRPVQKYCKEHKVTYETLEHLKNLTRAGDWKVSFDLTDGYYTLSIREEDRLVGLPMGWKCNNYYFCRLSEVFIRHLREPLPNPNEHNSRMSTNQRPSRRYLRSSRWRGARLLLYMDDLLFFVDSKDAALHLLDRVTASG
jgi:hypothetical protein